MEPRRNPAFPPRRRRRWIGLRPAAEATLLLVFAAFATPAKAADSLATDVDSLAAVADSAHAADSLAALAADTTAIDSSSFARAAASLAAPSEQATPETVSVAAPEAVPVFLGGREIFRVRSNRDGLAPAARAAAIRARLDAAVRDDVPPDSARLFTTPEGVEVRLGRHFLWMITTGDVEGESVGDLAVMMSELPGNVADGIRSERAGRRPLRVLISFLIALGITLVAWIVARLLWTGRARWRGFLDRVLPRYLKGLRFRNFEVLSQAQLTGLVGGALARVDVIVGLLLLYGYLTAVFSLFPWTQGWSWLLVNFARLKLLEALAALGAAVPGLIVIAVILYVFRWLVRLSDRFFNAVSYGTLTIGGFHPDLARPSKRIVRILLWVIAVMIAYPYIPGAQSKAVQGVSLLLGVMVSLGSTGFVGNVISGIVLTYARSFSPGERVKIGDHTGDIVSLGFFATKLRSLKNEEVTLPNGQVASQPIVNYSRLAKEDGLVLHTEVTIGYDVEWRKVHALMVEAAGKVDGIEAEPVPWVIQRALNDYHVSYELNAVTHDAGAQVKLYSRLHEEIQDAFARAGVEIISPAFQALRDANAPVMPGEPKGPRAEPGGFRVRPEAKG